jgi:type I restriction-modification system DNA methylase subunit/predicted type IV restriction endonuclease
MLPSNEIKNLVERFSQNISSYSASAYNETQLRQEFLNPFFEALGWDVSNKQGYAEAYKEVIHEDAVKIGTATKAPDYSFRVGGTRKFFVEAKKPFINIKDDIDPAFQLRRYAWSAKLPLSVLTDFEEFAVYDCRLKPSKTDKASIGRIFYIKYDEYEKRWDEISAIFSKDAVLKGSFDKYAETNRAKKGTTEVDDAFLSEIEDWRDVLARNIAIRNEKLSSRELNFAVQRTIDRLIFLRICEDRGIEDYGRLQAHLNGESVYKRLCVLFREADERYNSGLFHFREEKGREETPDNITLKLDIDDKVLKQIIQNLYYPDSAYEFSVLPADILGQVYEQFLGKVIRLTAGHQAKVEDKPDVKKAGGVFYTPTYIVDYIVKNTVGKLLEGKTPKQAAALRILDPACGSGSFLIGAYQYLLDWHRDWYTKNDPAKWLSGKIPSIYKARAGEYRLTTPERKKVLLNNIYGVDIDTQAVEVTKLSLLLKVLEGENEQSIAQQLKLFHERALPDLGNNIKCGNSLIGTDYFIGVQESMGLYADEEDEQTKINAFDWDGKDGFAEIMKNGGFDAVVGNPPYGVSFGEKEKQYFSVNYKCQSYQHDSYLLFLERSISELLRETGYFGMIIPNPWLTNLLQTNTRRFVTSKCKIVEIVHFRFPVFHKVTVDTEIVLLQNSLPNKWRSVVTVCQQPETLLKHSESELLHHIYHEQSKWQKLDGGTINIFTSKSDERLAKKCLVDTVPLENLLSINVGIKPYQVGKGDPPQTKEIVETRPFDSNKKQNSLYRQYLRGSDISRYVICPIEDRFLKYGPWLAEPRPAADFDARLKIVIRQTGDSLVAAIDANQHLCLNNMHVLVPTNKDVNLLFLLGVINSSLLNWYYHTLNPEVGEALAEVKKTNVARLPIKLLLPTDKNLNTRIVSLVSSMLELNKKLRRVKTEQEKTIIYRQIDSTDRRIDELVYELYGLTDEEIRIVESANA